MTGRQTALLKARIIATGSYVPENVITNNDLEQIIETSDEWIMERTGIKERRIVNGSQSTSDLAYEAAHEALKRAGLKPGDIDLIIGHYFRRYGLSINSVFSSAEAGRKKGGRL
jgi:hypothetical protein